MVGLVLLSDMLIWIRSAQQAGLLWLKLATEGLLVLTTGSENNNLSIGMLLSAPEDKDVTSVFLPWCLKQWENTRQWSTVVCLIHFYWLNENINLEEISQNPVLAFFAPPPFYVNLVTSTDNWERNNMLRGMLSSSFSIESVLKREIMWPELWVLEKWLRQLCGGR